MGIASWVAFIQLPPMRGKIKNALIMSRESRKLASFSNDATAFKPLQTIVFLLGQYTTIFADLCRATYTTIQA